MSDDEEEPKRVEEEEGKGGVAEGSRTVIVDGDVVMLSGDGDMSDQGPRTMDVGMVALSILKFLDGVHRNLHEQEEWLVKRNTFLLADVADVRSTIARQHRHIGKYLAELGRVLGTLREEHDKILEEDPGGGLDMVTDSLGMQSTPWTGHWQSGETEDIRYARLLETAGMSAHWETGKQLGLEVWNLFSSSPDMRNRKVGVVATAMHAELWKVSTAAFKVDALVTEMTIAHDTIAHARRVGRIGSDMCRRLSNPIRP